MKYAIIENGLVINVVIAEAHTAHMNGWVECPNAGPGWGYDGTTFTEPVVAPAPEPAAPTKEQLLAQLQAIQAQIQAL
jgi:hypothetical protein